MNAEYSPYLFIVLLGLAALAFALTPLALAWLWAKIYSPNKPSQEKNAIYECGLESKGDAWILFKSEYYLYGIIFLIFDVETIFLFPWAVLFSTHEPDFRLAPLFGLASMFVFLGILIIGYIWLYRKGADRKSTRLNSSHRT